MIRISLDTSNAAFHSAETTDDARFDFSANRAANRKEVARILHKLADDLACGFIPSNLFDIDGNTVGRLELTGKDR